MNGIFVFTKDRPTTLLNTFRSLTDISSFIYLIDDSIESRNIIANKQIVNSHPGALYFGSIEFDNFTAQAKINTLDYTFLIKKLGSIGWNLGYSRNLALLIAKKNKFKTVLFLDDDIIIPHKSVVENGFARLDKVRFSGCNITGLEDNSLVGYISAECGQDQERMISGGCMFFRPEKVKHYFTNIYNEDWIWLFLNDPQYNFSLKDVVEQIYKDQFDNYTQKIIDQELGELIVEGFLCAKFINSKNRKHLLLDKSFWEDIINERKLYIKSLSAIVQKDSHMVILNHLLSNHKQFQSEHIVKILELYYSRIKLVRKLFGSMLN